MGLRDALAGDLVLRVLLLPLFLVPCHVSSCLQYAIDLLSEMCKSGSVSWFASCCCIGPARKHSGRSPAPCWGAGRWSPAKSQPRELGSILWPQGGQITTTQDE